MSKTVLPSTDEMSQEEILENEGNLLSDLLELAKRKENEAFFRNIEIRGEGGQVKARFRLRPMSSEDVESCLKQATALVKNLKGKAEKEVNQRLFQSILIYTATIPEDQKGLWGNIELKRALNVLDNFDMVDKLLLAGEKASVLSVIDEMGGFTEEVAATAKN
ncbi:MAG: hypothetical protein R3Y63_04165 [Eubacteriales bacterium]